MESTTPQISSDKDFHDPLLDCLVLYSKLHGFHYSGEALVSGLPIEQKKRLTPELFSRAAERANIQATFRKRDLSELSNLVLPCIVPLKDNQACLLEKIDDQQQATILMPSTGEGRKTKPLAELQEEFMGYVIFLTEKISQASRKESLINKQEGHW